MFRAREASSACRLKLYIISGKMKKRLLNIWQFICVLTLSCFDKSLELHLPKRRIIETSWPGFVRKQLICIASITVPLKQIKFSGEVSKGSWSSHPKYKFYRAIIEGRAAEDDPYFLKNNFKSKRESQAFLLQRKEVLRLAVEGDQSFDIAGAFWVDGSVRIVDGEHRTLALAALGKTQIRLGIVLDP